MNDPHCHYNIADHIRRRRLANCKESGCAIGAKGQSHLNIETQLELVPGTEEWEYAYEGWKFGFSGFMANHSGADVIDVTPLIERRRKKR